MARKSKTEKLNDIELKIKELEEQRKAMLLEMQSNIGKALISKWDCTDEQIILQTIEHLSDLAIEHITSLENSQSSEES